MKKKICFIVATPITAKVFLREHFAGLLAFYDITLMADFSSAPLMTDEFPCVNCINVPIPRNISLLKDLLALFLLIRSFRVHRFAAVHSLTPKAGLLAMVAARLACVPARFHTFTGQVWVTKRGLFRWLLRSLDTLTFLCATKVLVDSPSQRDFLLTERVVTAPRSDVLGMGSVSGVDLARFRPDRSARQAIRKEYGLSDDAFLYLFVGRANREKGLEELMLAFEQLNREGLDVWLMLVGPDEDTILVENEQIIQSFGRRFLRHGHTDTPERFMAAADVFCLPSHREGFGTVIIEAGACGVPSLASNIYGVSDAIENGVTGILHVVREPDDIAVCMASMFADRVRTRQMGNNARLRAEERFSVSTVVQAMISFYQYHVA